MPIINDKLTEQVSKLSLMKASEPERSNQRRVESISYKKNACQVPYQGPVLFCVQGFLP